MDHYAKENYNLSQSVGFTLTRARNMITAELDSALKELDISSQQMGILLSLTSGAAATPFELSKLLGIDTGLMTRMLDKLETKGFLNRSRSVEDRRVINLTMTEKGKEVTTRIREIAPQVLNARLRKFTEVEFKELGRLLQKFISE